MHRCLRVLDILEAIFNYVFEIPDDGSSGGNPVFNDTKTMLALACTCRPFQDTALDVLWREIPSFIPLVLCLPPDAWRMGANWPPVFSLVRPTTLSDWARCKTYTPRIRRLGFFEKDGFYLGVTAEIMAVLEQYQVLPLPNLQVYRGRGSLVQPLGSSLIELGMVYHTRMQASELPKLIDSLKTTSPFIQKIAVGPVHDVATPLKLPASFGDVIACFSRLTILSIVNYSLPDNALRTLTSSDIIRGLKINNTSEDILRCLPSHELILPKLEEISFRTGRLSECSDILRNLVPQRLRSIVVTHDLYIAKVPMTETQIYAFFQALETYCATTALASISFHQTNFKAQNEANLVCTMVTLEPLFSFRNLRELELDFHEIHYDLDNTSIERIVTAWPKMRRFSLDFEDSESIPEVTLDGLLPMAENWPQLEYLSLIMNGDTLYNEIPLLKPGAGLCCPHLQCFDVGRSSLNSDHLVVAAFLTAIFPNLDSIKSDRSDSLWVSVMRAVRVMRKVRKQERAHAYAEWKANTEDARIN